MPSWWNSLVTASLRQFLVLAAVPADRYSRMRHLRHTPSDPAAAPRPETSQLALHLSGDYWQVLPTDTIPNGYVTPAPVTTKDGTTGIFEKIGNPTEMFRWYLKVG